MGLLRPKENMMRRIKRIAIAMLLAISMALPLPAVGFPVFSATEFAQQAAQWIDTINQYVQQTKKWIEDADRIKNALVAISSGDFNKVMNGVQDILGTVSDWNITSGLVDNVLDSLGDNVGAIQNIVNQGEKAFNQSAKAWSFIEDLQNLDWGDPSSWYDNITGTWRDVLAGVNTTAGGLSQGFGNMGHYFYTLGQLDMSVGLLQESDLEEKIKQASDDMKTNLDNYFNALENDNQVAAEQYRTAYENAKESYNSLLAQQEEVKQHIKELNEDYNKAIAGATDNANQASRLLVRLGIRGGVSDTVEAWFDDENQSFSQKVLGI